MRIVCWRSDLGSPDLPPSLATAPLTITNAIVNGVAMPFGKLPTNGAAIQLDQGNHNLRVDFALLDYQAPMETVYSYRMDGLDEDWTSMPKGSLPKIGRASCRERVCQYVSISVVDVSLKKNTVMQNKGYTPSREHQKKQ